MKTETLTLMKKSIGSPDEIRHFGKGKMEITHLEETTISRMTLRPGWRWSHDARPVLGTQNCPCNHTLFVVSGRLMVLMEDGHEIDLQVGDVAVVPAGHDAWVVGDESCVLIDFTGAKDYLQHEESELSSIRDWGLDFG